MLIFLCSYKYLFWDPVKVLRNIVILLGLSLIFFFLTFVNSRLERETLERGVIFLIYLFSLFIDLAAPGLSCSTQGGLSLGFSVAAGKLVFGFVFF